MNHTGPKPDRSIYQTGLPYPLSGGSHEGSGPFQTQTQIEGLQYYLAPTKTHEGLASPAVDNPTPGAFKLDVVKLPSAPSAGAPQVNPDMPNFSCSN